MSTTRHTSSGGHAPLSHLEHFQTYSLQSRRVRRAYALGYLTTREHEEEQADLRYVYGIGAQSRPEPLSAEQRLEVLFASCRDCLDALPVGRVEQTLQSQLEYVTLLFEASTSRSVDWPERQKLRPLFEKNYHQLGQMFSQVSQALDTVMSTPVSFLLVA